ncbi:MAG: hypothetical protein H6Q54_249 [Deltaproteobacteria bacterium]|nr:hypothetical protein [Deltaproteobacteria bacterium]
MGYGPILCPWCGTDVEIGSVRSSLQVSCYLRRWENGQRLATLAVNTVHHRHPCHFASVLSLSGLYIVIARSVSDVAISMLDSFASLGMTHVMLFIGHYAGLDRIKRTVRLCVRITMSRIYYQWWRERRQSLTQLSVMLCFAWLFLVIHLVGGEGNNQTD